jgi:hypothetical protein
MLTTAVLILIANPTTLGVPSRNPNLAKIGSRPYRNAALSANSAPRNRTL